MANIGTLTARIGADYSDLDRGLFKAKQSLDNFANTAFKAVGIAAAAMSAVVVYELGKIGNASVETAKSFEAMAIKLDALTKGKGTETLEAINKWALDMPVNTEKTVQAFTTMMAMGLDPTLEKLGTLVDTSVLFGEDALPRVSRALGQMAALGKLSAEELNQLSEVGINARKYLTEAFGMTVEELQKTGTEIEEIIDVIWSGLAEEFGGAAEKAMDMWAGLTATIESYGTELKRLVMASGPMEAFKMILKEIVDNLEAWMKSGDMVAFAQETGQAVVSIIANMVEAIGWIPTAFFAVKESVHTVTSYISAMAEKTIELAMVAEMVQKPWKLLQFSMETINEETKTLDEILAALFPNLGALKKSIADLGVVQAESALAAAQNAEKFASWGVRAGELAQKIRGIKVDLSGIGGEDAIGGLGDSTKKATSEMEKLVKSVGSLKEILDQGLFELEVKAVIAELEVKSLSVTSPNIPEPESQSAYDLLGEWSKIINQTGYDFNELISLSGESFSASSVAAGTSLAAAYGEMILQTIQAIEHIIKLPQQIVEATSSLLDTIGSFGSDLTGSLNNLIDSLYDAVVGIGDIFTQLVPKLLTITQELTLAFVRAVPELIRAIVDSIPIIIDTVVYEIPRITAEIIAEIPKIIAALVESIPDITTSAIEGLSNSLESLWDDIGDLLDDAVGWITGSDGNKAQYLGGLTSISFNADDLFTVEWLESYARRVSDEAAQETAEAMVELIETVLQTYEQLFVQLPTELQGIVEGLMEDFNIELYVKSSGGHLEEYWTTAMEAIPDQIADILDPVFEQAIDAYAQSFLDLLDDTTIAAQFGDVIDLEDFYEALNTIQNYLDSAAEATLDEMEAVLEAIEDIQEMWDDILAPIENLFDEIADIRTEQTREGWGVAEYSTLFSDLTQQLAELDDTSSSYYSDSLDILTELLDVTEEIEKLQQYQLDALEASLSSVGDMIQELTGGALAPAESAEWYDAQYQAMIDAIMAAQGTDDINQAVSDFLSFIPAYLDFMSDYGVDYATLTAQVVSDLQGIQGLLQTDIDALSSGIDEIAIYTGETVSALDYISGQLASMQDWVETISPSEEDIVNAIDTTSVIVDTVITEEPTTTYDPNGVDWSDIYTGAFRTKAENINLNVYLDGKPIRAVVTEGLKSRDSELINAVRRAVR